MRIPILFCLIIMSISCTKKSDDIPQTPDSPSNKPFGKLLFFQDTLIAWDATTGNLLYRSDPYGTLVGSYVNNTVVSDSLVYQTTVNSILAMNFYTNKFVYRKIFSYYSYSWGGVTRCFPVVDGNYLYMDAYNNSGHFKLYKIDKKTGATIWESPATISYDQTPYVAAIVQIPDGIIVNTSEGPACFDKATGTRRWLNNSSFSYKFMTTYGIVSGDVYVTQSDKDKKVFAFNINTGDLVWSAALPADYTTNGGFFHENNGNIYITTLAPYAIYPNNTGIKITALNASTGALVREIALPDARKYITYDKDNFYVFTFLQNTFFPQRIIKYSLSTGLPIWSSNLDGGINYGFTVTPNYIYCVETDPTFVTKWQRITILNPSNGVFVKSFAVVADGEVRTVVVEDFNKWYTTTSR